MKKKNVATIIVLYNTPKKCIEHLRRNLLREGVEEKAIYFRDNSHDNVGYGAAINEIIKNQLNAYDFFLILNPDVILYKNFLDSLLGPFLEDKKIGIVGPKIFTNEKNIWSVGGELDKKRNTGGLIGFGQKDSARYKSIQSVDFVSGTAMLIKKAVFEQIGLFNNDYFLYYEDVDFCQRAKRAGFDVIVNPKAEIIHYVSLSVGLNSPAMQYYLSRNHFLFWERFSSLRIITYEILRLPKTLHQARKKHYELLGLRDYFLRRFGKRDYWS